MMLRLFNNNNYLSLTVITNPFYCHAMDFSANMIILARNYNDSNTINGFNKTNWNC